MFNFTRETGLTEGNEPLRCSLDVLEARRAKTLSEHVYDLGVLLNRVAYDAQIRTIERDGQSEREHLNDRLMVDRLPAIDRVGESLEVIILKSGGRTSAVDLRAHAEDIVNAVLALTGNAGR